MLLKINICTIKAIKVEATTSSLSFRMALLSANKIGREAVGIRHANAAFKPYQSYCNYEMTQRFCSELFLSLSEIILFYSNAQNASLCFSPTCNYKFKKDVTVFIS